MAGSRTRAALGAVLLGLVAGRCLAGVTVTLAVRDSAGAPVPGAVAWLQGAVPRPVAAPARVVVDQRDKAFVPEVTVIQAGTDVSFPNSDSVSHHVYSFARPNAFELPLYKGRSRPLVRFDHAGVVTLGCNIHDAMVGWIVVVETPHFATADDAGNVVLGDVPAGDYQAFVWSPRLDADRPTAAGQLSVGTAPVAATLAAPRRLRPAASGHALAGEDY